mgnify:CR=1 FL=1
MKKMYQIKTKYGTFGTIIWYDRADKAYLVRVPSLGNSATFGSSLADAKRMAADLIELLCEVAFDDGKVVIDDERRVFGRSKLARTAGVAELVA